MPASPLYMYRDLQRTYTATIDGSCTFNKSRACRPIHVIRAAVALYLGSSLAEMGMKIYIYQGNSAIQLTSVGLAYACPNKGRYIFAVYCSCKKLLSHLTAIEVHLQQ